MSGMDLTEWNKYFINNKYKAIQFIYLDLESRFSKIEDRLTQIEEELMQQRQLLEALKYKPLQDDLWLKIRGHAIERKTINLLNPRKDYPFHIVEATEDYIRVDKLGQERLTAQMFVSLTEYLKTTGDWIKIGATVRNTKLGTVEAFLKSRFHGGDMNATMTAPWVAALLVRANVGVIFNGKAVGQAIRYTG